jgi:hypothetical protein
MGSCVGHDVAVVERWSSGWEDAAASHMTAPWTDLDRDAARPTPPDVHESRQRLRFEASVLSSPAAAKVVEELQKVFVKGGVALKRFRVINQDATLHWFASRNRFIEYDLFALFLRVMVSLGPSAMARSGPTSSLVDVVLDVA